MNLQPILTNTLVTATPLASSHFDQLFAVASDATIWAQHPNPLRYQLSFFAKYFEGAMVSGGAFIITDTASGQVIGSTRYSRLQQAISVDIGYTFYATAYWGKGYNHSLKKMMLSHAFQYVPKVRFFIGASNLRSQISIERLGAFKVGEQTMAYHGEAPMHNFEYNILHTII